jgi:Flp pilus assembly protein TadG
MTGRLTALTRDDRGASLVEMALVAPFLAAIVIGMTDLSRAYSMKVQLTQAAQRGIEKAMQGKKTTTVYDTLQSEAAAAAGVATSAVAVRYWLECNNVSQMQSLATMNSDYNDRVCTGTPPPTIARYVSVDISKTYTPLFGTRFAGSNANGTYTLHGKAMIRVQ